MVSEPRLEEVLRYDPESGNIYWIVSRGSAKVHKIAGVLHPKTGYLTLGFNKKVYKAHRVAWYLYYGKWPEGDLDHINRDKLDNKIKNLREVTKRANTQNSKVFNSGVGRHNNKWRARISINGKQVHLGHFDSEEKAKKAYNAAINTVGS